MPLPLKQPYLPLSHNRIKDSRTEGYQEVDMPRKLHAGRVVEGKERIESEKDP